MALASAAVTGMIASLLPWVHKLNYFSFFNEYYKDDFNYMGYEVGGWTSFILFCIPFVISFFVEDRSIQLPYIIRKLVILISLMTSAYGIWKIYQFNHYGTYLLSEMEIFKNPVFMDNDDHISYGLKAVIVIGIVIPFLVSSLKDKKEDIDINKNDQAPGSLEND